MVPLAQVDLLFYLITAQEKSYPTKQIISGHWIVLVMEDAFFIVCNLYCYNISSQNKDLMTTVHGD